MAKHGGDEAAGDGDVLHLPDFIRQRQSEILADWEQAVRAMPAARDLSRPALIDHIPHLLARIAEIAEELAAGGAPHLPRQAAETHAITRLTEGFDLTEVVSEFSLLRDAILRRWHAGMTPPDADGLRLLNQSIDRAISASVDRYTAVRDRALHALDRIATAALESQNLDELLQRLLAVMVETLPAADTSAILLRENECLRVRAAIGLEAEVTHHFTLPIGKGFAGTVAALEKPLELRCAAEDPLVASDFIRAKKIRALYGIPMRNGGDVIGVAHIGSLTAYEFSEQDKRLLGVLANRATAAVHQHLLREQLDRRAAEMEAVLESIPEALLIGDERGYHAANRPALDLLGFDSVAQLSGDVDAVAERLEIRRAPGGEPVPADENTFMLALRGDVVTREVYARNIKTGQRIMIRSSAAPVRMRGKTIGAVMLSTDITVARRREQAQRFLAEASVVLSASLDLRTILNRLAALAVPQLADWCAVDLRHADATIERIAIAHADPAKTELAWHLAQDYPPLLDAPEMAGKVAASGRSELLVQIPSQMLRELARDEEHLRILTELGMTSAMIVPMISRGKPIGDIKFVFGESERRYDEEDLRTAEDLARRAGLAVENARLYRDAQNAVAVRDNILQVVSHDLRNPLNAISLSAGLLAKRTQVNGASAMAKWVDTVQRSADRMNRLIADLLDFGAVETGRLSITRAPVEAWDLVRDSIDAFETLAGEKHLQLRAGPPPSPLPKVLADRDRVLQVFSNLIGNAVKVTPPQRTITLTARAEASSVVFAVVDEGPGIAPEELGAIFQRYRRGTSAPYKGTGLGLAIARGIIEAHGGRIWAENNDSGGATFSFSLPVKS